MSTHLSPQLRSAFLLRARWFLGRGSKSRCLTMGNLSEVVTFELRLKWTLNYEQLWGGQSSRQRKQQRERCVIMSLPVSKKGRKPRRSFPGVNSYSGVTGPKVIDVFMALDIYCWIVFQNEYIYTIMCSIVNSHFPCGVQFRGRQDGKRDFKVSIFCMI